MLVRIKELRMTQEIYQKAIKFAGEKHKNQKVPGTNSNYLLHLSNVAMEILIAGQHTSNFDTNFAVQVALLHDVIEDTDTTIEELQSLFGKAITEAVLALTKNIDLTKEQKMQDSLNRIKKLQPEVWAVKLADRITNLQQPPSHWDAKKKQKYLKQAKLILKELKNGNEYLEKRLEAKILEYEKYLDPITVHLPNDLKKFIEKQKWIFAKTYAKTWPHEYIVQQKVDNEKYLNLAAYIDAQGYESNFYNTKQIYFDYNGFTYWHMENIINRCVYKDTYHQREIDGRLPDNYSIT